jgi:hypothetical protein
MLERCMFEKKHRFFKLLPLYSYKHKFVEVGRLILGTMRLRARLPCLAHERYRNLAKKNVLMP